MYAVQFAKILNTDHHHLKAMFRRVNMMLLLVYALFYMAFVGNDEFLGSHELTKNYNENRIDFFK